MPECPTCHGDLDRCHELARGEHRRRPAGQIETPRCINCHRQMFDGRVLYCTERCSKESRAKTAKKEKG